MSDSVKLPDGVLPDRAQPHALNVERAVLGAMLREPESCIDLAVAQFGGQEVFYAPAHRVVYSALVELHTGGKDADLVSLAQLLKERGKLVGNTIVTTIMSNMGLYKACEAIGIRTEKTAVGDKYVAENMMQNHYVLGGEQSGHIIFGKYATTGDGILTSLMVMMTMLDKKLPLSMLAGEMKMYPQCLKNVVVKDKKAAQENPVVVAAVAKVNQELDGNGRMLLRASGTEPKIRVMVEASTDEICEKYVDQLIEVIKSEGLTAD